MVRYYNELTRLEMEQVDKDETVVMIPVGALEQHGNQCPLGTDEIIAEGTARRIKEALDREIPDFLIFVGTVSDHTLRIGGEEISLRDLCGRSAKVRIRYEERWI